jgi:hypothetical protein
MKTINQYTASDSGTRNCYQSAHVSKKLLAIGKGVLALLAILAVTYWLVPIEVALENATAVAEQASQ